MTDSAEDLPRRGRYALVEKLGEGGMGAVHIALHDDADALCVLKQLLPEVEQNEIAVRRFYREAAIGARLDHPRIARVFGAGTEDGVFCIAMELVLGLDLEIMHNQMMATGRVLPVELVIHVALGVLAGLEYAHGAAQPDGTPLGVVHRDISPRNIMVGLDGEAKLIDFGLVRATGDALQTRAGSFLGTPRFTSPEQAVGMPVDARSDLYSLSVVLFELLTATPLVKTGGTIFATLAAVVNDPAPPISGVNPAISRPLSDVIARGLVKDRALRWADAASYARALREAFPGIAAIGAADIAAFMRESFVSETARMRSLVERGERIASARRAMRTAVSTPREISRSFDEEDGTTSFVEFGTVVFRPSLPPDQEPTVTRTRLVPATRAPTRVKDRSSPSLARRLLPLAAVAVASSLVTAIALRSPREASPPPIASASPSAVAPPPAAVAPIVRAVEPSPIAPSPSPSPERSARPAVKKPVVEIGSLPPASPPPSPEPVIPKASVTRLGAAIVQRANALRDRAEVGAADQKRISTLRQQVVAELNGGDFTAALAKLRAIEAELIEIERRHP